MNRYKVLFDLEQHDLVLKPEINRSYQIDTRPVIYNTISAFNEYCAAEYPIVVTYDTGYQIHAAECPHIFELLHQSAADTVERLANGCGDYRLLFDTTLISHLAEDCNKDSRYHQAVLVRCNGRRTPISNWPIFN